MSGIITHPRTGQQLHRKFVLTKEQTFDLITGYSAELRIRVNRRWMELEGQQEKPAIDFTNPDTILKLAQSYKNEYDKRLLAEKKIQEDKPKVEFADIVIKSDKGITVGEFACCIYGSECGERGRNQMFDKLRKLGYLKGDKRNRKEWNIPYIEHIRAGLFVVDTTTYVDKNTKMKYTHRMPLITGKGQIHLTEKLRTA